MSTDAEVIRESLTRPALFAELYDRHHAVIHRFVARRVDQDVADDLASETFLVAFESRKRFDQRRDDALPWLYGIVTNLLRDDAASPDPASVAAGRHALTERIARRSGVHRRGRVLWVSGGAIATVGLVAALVSTDVVGLAGWRGGADSAAAAALHSAALETLKTSDPVVGPGQYLKVSTDAVSATITDDAAYLATQNGQLYIPEKKTDGWVWVRDASTVARTFGAACEKAAREGAGDGQQEVVGAPEGAF